MPTGNTGVDQVLAVLLGPDAPTGDDPHAWLAAGLRLGVERPEEARRLLGQLVIPAPNADSMEAAVEAGAGTVAATRAGAPAADAEPPSGAVDADGMPVVPVRSLILARSAAMSRAQQEESGPEVVFAWAGRLLPGEIAAIGRVVQQMLDDGAPNDVARGFGIAWTGGVKLPSGELEGMFKEFVDLQLTVASVLSGQDLRDLPPLPSATGLGGILHGWFGRPNPVSREADTVIERAGRNGQLALVALWNAWVGLRYRPLMPAATFEQLLHPWITVVGPVPEG